MTCLLVEFEIKVLTFKAERLEEIKPGSKRLSCRRGSRWWEGLVEFAIKVTDVEKLRDSRRSSAAQAAATAAGVRGGGFGGIRNYGTNLQS